jgi:hypothetical protein
MKLSGEAWHLLKTIRNECFGEPMAALSVKGAEELTAGRWVSMEPRPEGRGALVGSNRCDSFIYAAARSPELFWERSEVSGRLNEKYELLLSLSYMVNSR